jgi:hypothetical protein
MILRVDGEVSAPRDFDFDALAALPGQVPDVAPLVPGREGGAVQLGALLAAAGRLPSAAHATLASGDGFTISVPLAAVAQALVAYRLGDGPLPDKKGGPARFYVPGVDKCEPHGAAPAPVDACANVKGLARITLTANPGPPHVHES